MVISNTLMLSDVSLLALNVKPYWHFFGVLHPAVAHFPIALLLVAGMIEAWRTIAPSRSGRGPGDAAFVCLVLGSIAAIVASTLGWANADAGGAFNGKLAGVLTLHRWMGVAVAIVGIVTVIMATIARRRTEPGRGLLRAYRGSAILAAVLVGAVGSFGGKLTHGVDYYNDAYEDMIAAVSQQKDESQKTTAPDSAAQDAPSTLDSSHDTRSVNDAGATDTTVTGADKDDDSAQAATRLVNYDHDIKPMLQKYCFKCHSEEKKKGGYRLDTRDFAFTPGESDEAPIVPGRSVDSLLIKVVKGEGEFEDSVMPPKGAVLDETQIALLSLWIDQGAVWPDDPSESQPSATAPVIHARSADASR